MPKHILTPKNPDVANHIEVRYSRKRGSYIVRVLKTSSDQVKWTFVQAGLKNGEAITETDAINLVRAYAYIPAELEKALQLDEHLATCPDCGTLNLSDSPVVHWSPTVAMGGPFAPESEFRVLIDLGIVDMMPRRNR